MDTIIFGVLAVGFLLYSAFLNLKSKKEEEENILMEVLSLFAGVRLALIGVRASAEMALVDYNMATATTINAGSTLLLWLNYLVVAFIALKLLFTAFRIFGKK